MKKVHILSLVLALGTSSLQVSCSRDSSSDEQSSQNENVDALYALLRTVESDLSQGYLLRSASDNERKMFDDILYSIKVATMRLRKDVNDGEALSALYLASQEFDKLNILEQDGSQLDGLKNQLRLTLDTVARIQGKTLENVERVLFSKEFDYELAPFAPLTAQNKTGWTKKNHNEIHYAIAEGSKLNSWLLSPRFDFTNVSNPSFTVKQAINSRGNPYSNSVFFMVSTNYEGGDPAKADWEALSVQRLPDGNGFATVDTENVSLARFAGKKVVLAFHYDSTSATTYPTWQINSFKLFGSGTLGQSELNLAGATVTGSTPTASLVAPLCTTNPSAKKIFSYQFDKGSLGTNFSVIEDPKMLNYGGDKYPGVITFSGFGGSNNPNKVGTAWVVSKAISLAGAKDVCLSFADDVYFPKGNVDTTMTEVLVSTDFAGDVEKATWKTVEVTGRKTTPKVVVASSLAPKGVGLMLKDLGLESAEKVHVAFRYKSSLVEAPWWGVGDLTLTAIPAGDAPLVVTPVDAVAGSTNTGNKPATNGGTSKPATPFVPNGPIVADVCKNLSGATDLMSHQFTGAAHTEFTPFDAEMKVNFIGGDKYKGLTTFSGYNKDGNKVGTSWLVSKTLDLSTSSEVCLSVAEIIFSVKSAADLAATEILVSTDYAGDVNTATWKAVALPSRTFKTSNANSDVAHPVASGLLIRSLLGADAKNVTVGLRYKSTTALSPWWGVGDVTVRAVPTTPKAEEPAAEVKPEPETEEEKDEEDPVILLPSPV